MRIINAKILTCSGIVTGSDVIIRGDRVAEITGSCDPRDGDLLLDAKGKYLSPGFVDIHCHGGGGADFMDGTTKAFETACKTHLKHGTTTIVPTSVASSDDDLKSFTCAFRTAALIEDLPGMPGIHLEGPYLSPEMSGAIDPEFIRVPSQESVNWITAITDGILLRWTIAPELEGSCELGKYLAGINIHPSIGHSNGYFEDAVRAADNGFKTVTHIYSSMSTIRRESGFRRSGILEAALLMDDLSVEVIADGRHLPSELLRLIHRIKGTDRIILVSDAMRAAGTDADESVLGSTAKGVGVIIEDGVAKLPDRSSFAGSIATCDTLVRTMRDSGGAKLTECIQMMTSNPAKAIGLDHDIGTIEPGYKADLIVFDEQINVSAVILGGRIMHGL